MICSSDSLNDSCAIDVKVDGSEFDVKSYLRWWNCLSLLNWIDRLYR